MGKGKTRNAFGICMLSTSLALVILLAAGGTAHARSGYLSTFNTKYGTSGTKLDGCGTCHGAGGNSTFNPYGSAIRTLWLSSGQVTNTELTAVEPADSDGDSFTNLVEINARFFPGDANDHPAVGVGAMSVAPAAGLTSSGTVGGPFTPASAQYTLTNTGGAPINFSAGATQTWVHPVPTSGTLAAGANATVTVSIGTEANSLAAGSYNDTVTFTNTTNGTGDTTRPVSLTVTAVGAPTITTPSPLPAGTVGTAYNQTLAATGGTPPLSWSVTVGTPPAGLTLSSAGAISGTPTTAGTSNFTVQATGGGTATKAFALTINAAGVSDNTAPTVSSTSPDNNATGVAVGTAVTGTFSEAIDNTTVNITSFILSDGVDNVVGTFSVNGAIVTFTPSAPLADNTTYTARLTTAIKDLAGNALAAEHVWTFTTAAAVAVVLTTSDDDGGWFGCAISPSGGGIGGILGTYGPLALLVLGIAFRRRVLRRKA